jgi:hypothetical protein
MEDEQKQYWENRIRSQSERGEYATLNPLLVETLINWVCHKLEPGGFVTAVLTNNLFDAVGRADSHNKGQLPLIVSFIYNHLPSGSFGSPEVMEQWRDV